jgi:hypothetical protein
MIWRALSKAGVPSLKEPHGLSRLDGKRPDGLTLIPWHEGRSATWDVTVTNTVATSYLSLSSISAASAAENAAQRKEIKYSEIMKTHLFYPLAFETLGPINSVGREFLSELGHRISAVTDDPRETSFLFQRIAVSIQRFNAVCFSYAFEHGHNFSTSREAPGDFTHFLQFLSPWEQSTKGDKASESWLQKISHGLCFLIRVV